jgi:hypothetical protein
LRTNEAHGDELELSGTVGRVDDEDLVGGFVRVGGDVLAVDRVGLVWGWRIERVREREALEVLEEAGFHAAHEGLEALGRRLGAVVEDALLQREGGADANPLEGPGVVSLPRDEGLVVAGDGQDVRVEAALFEGVGRGVGADPVPVAYAVGAGLGLAVPAGFGGWVVY